MAESLALEKENQELRNWISSYQTNERLAQRKIALYVYEHQLEQELLRNDILKLNEQILRVKNELSMFDTKDIESDIEWDDNGEIRGASVEKLIDFLYYDHGTKMTMEFVKVFLLTYHAFTTPREIIDQLMKRYVYFSSDAKSQEKWKAERLRIGNFLRKWVTENFNDFNDKELQDRYDQFNKLISRCDSKLAENIHATYAKKKSSRRGTSTLTFNNEAPAVLKPKTPITSILDIPALEFARQLTITESALCRAIEPKECLGMAWTKKDKETRSKNLLSLIKRFNQLNSWIAYCVVSEPNIRTRVKILTHVIEILQHLMELNNFNAVFCIIAGLGNSAVYRLNKTFAELKPDKKRVLEEIRFMTNPDRSWFHYRNKIHSVNPPLIPFLGVYQTDLTFIEEGNKDRFASGLVNFKKCRLTANVITEIQQYQTQPYNLTVVPPIQMYISQNLTDFGAQEDKKLFDLSLIAEPRE